VNAKKIISCLILFIFLTTTSVGQVSFKDLVGRWENTDGVGLEITDSSTIFLFQGSQKKKLTEFSFNFSTSPCWFDFYLKDSSVSMGLKSLFLMVNKNLIQWQLFEESRPENFSSGRGEMVYLRRKQ
jgi:hypothetical protein